MIKISNNNRYRVYSNYIGVKDGFTYYLVDTHIAVSFFHAFPDQYGKTVKWDKDGGKLAKLAETMNEQENKS